MRVRRIWSCPPTVSAARRLREPVMAIDLAVPYLPIIAGFCHVWQGAAFGLIRMAIAHHDRSRPLPAIVVHPLATGS